MSRAAGACGAALADAALIDWIGAMGAKVETLAGVCTGSMLLGKAGLLDGRRATTHWQSLQWMRESYPAVTVVDDQHVVEDGVVLTSAGISAGIDLGLRLVARLLWRGDCRGHCPALGIFFPRRQQAKDLIAKTADPGPTFLKSVWEFF